MEQKNDQIKQLVIAYCREHLDSAYLDICTKVYNDLLKKDTTTFERGNAEIWAAAVVWAIGGENFLSDKSFKPYATLSDVCSFFNVKTSTVGQKSRKIKDILEISLWNPEYRLPGSKIGNFLDSLTVTKNGFIVPNNMFDDDDKDKSDIEVVEEDATPEYYLIIFKPVKKVPAALYYQLEYQLKKIIEKDESYIKSKREDNGKFSFMFFGWWDSVEKIQEYTHAETDFVVSDIYFADSAEDLEEISV